MPMTLPLRNSKLKAAAMQPQPPSALSVEMRAQLVADAIGRVTEGDCRKRVAAAAAEQIREALAVQAAQLGRRK